MVGTGLVNLADKPEPLPEEFGPEKIVDPLPLANELNGFGEKERENNGIEKKKREIVLGRNVHTTCFSVVEPEADDEQTGDREAIMASVLARYRRSLVERTKHHLGICFFSLLLSFNLIFLIIFLLQQACSFDTILQVKFLL